MKTRLLGPSPLRSSPLAYGCWRIAPSNDDTQNHAIAKAAIFAAIDSGYTLFDHADIYCAGRSEEVFGRILRENPGLRDRLLIATKCGIRSKDQPPGAPARYDFSRDYIVSQCERSLQRLGIDCIDLLQLHRPDYLMEAEEVASAFAALRQAGKVREFGVSNFRPSQVSLLQSALPFPLCVNQIEVSLLQMQSLEDGTLDQCQEKKLTPMAWSPLGGGLLGDGGKDLLPGQMSYDPSAVLTVLQRLADEHRVPKEAIALAWILKHPSQIVPIVGTTHPERIRRMAVAASIDLTREDWYHLLTAARREPLP